MKTLLGPFRTIAHQTALEPANGRPILDYFRSILSKFEAFVRTFSTTVDHILMTSRITVRTMLSWRMEIYWRIALKTANPPK